MKTINRRLGRRGVRWFVLWTVSAFAANVCQAEKPDLRARTTASPAPFSRAATDAEDISAIAREVLARMPAESRLAEIADPEIRQTAQEVYRAVEALAGVRDQKELPGLRLKFETAYSTFMRQAARGKFRTCIENCRTTDGEPCRKRCKTGGSTGCGCHLVIFGCLVAECIF